MNTLFQPLTQTRPRDEIFGSLEDVLSGTVRLERLCTFNAQLAKLRFPYVRATTLSKVVEVWQQALEALKGPVPSVEAFKEKLIKELEPTRKVMSTAVSDFLTSQFTFVTTAEGMVKVARRILKDCNSVMVPPVKRSAAGLTGPTLLVSYPRSDLGDEFSLIAYVLKWTNREEIGGNLLYNGFLHQLAEGRSFGISIPIHSGYDFSNKLCKTAEGEVFGLAPSTSATLKASFHSVVSAFDNSLDLHGREIMVMERIQGENLFEFGRFKYHTLTEPQRKQLFNDLGKLAVLDVLFGNNDRLLQLSLNPDNQYQLDTYEANLGNMMLAQTKENGDPRLYGIDNGVHTDFISNSTTRTAYLSFIHRIFSTKSPETAMASHIVQSIRCGFTSTADNGSSSVKEVLGELKPILEDLSSLAAPSIEAGIRDMIGTLRTELIPAWNSEASTKLKKQLALLHPELLEAVSERLTIFATTKESS